MYRFLIVDDEPDVREGIAEIIDWKAHGFTLVGTCRDGREASKAIERLRPDVVLTDICMPFVDGLELASLIAERYPETRTILLTGHDEFEYAQEAVKLKVSDFLLKPITADEVRALLESVRAGLDDDRRRKRKLQKLKKQVTESLPVLRERFLNRLVRAVLPPAELARKLSLLDLSLPGPCYGVLVCDLDSGAPDDDLAALALQNTACEAARAYGGDAVCFATPRDESVILLSAPDGGSVAARALECAEAICDRIAGELSRTASAGIGGAVADLTLVPGSYAQARAALERRLVLGPGQVITVDELQGTAAPAQDGQGALARAGFVAALRTGSVEDARAALREIGEGCRSSGGEACFVAMQRLLADALNALESLGVEVGQIPDLGGNPFERLGRLKTLEDMTAWLLRLFGRARELLEERRRLHSESKAIEAVELVQARYAQPDLSLGTVCRALAVSKSYFSTVFKAHTGRTFVEYLTDVRMEKARELLAGEDLRSYEVADRVGFRDAHYFSLAFKKHTGSSPTEYRDLARAGAR